MFTEAPYVPRFCGFHKRGLLSLTPVEPTKLRSCASVFDTPRQGRTTGIGEKKKAGKF